MKDIKEVTKDFRSFTDWIYQQVTDKKNRETITDDEAVELDKKGYKLISEQGIDMVMAKVSKIASLNILDKNVSFEVFDRLPRVWAAYQQAAEVEAEATTERK